MPEENIETPVKIGKFSASVTIVKESWNILKQDKEIMLFPIFSTICTFLSIALMGALYSRIIPRGVSPGM